MSEMPSTRRQSFAFSISGNPAINYARALDLDHSQVHGQAQISIFKLRETHGLPSVDAGSAALLPLSMAQLRDSSARCLFDHC